MFAMFFALFTNILLVLLDKSENILGIIEKNKMFYNISWGRKKSENKKIP